MNSNFSLSLSLSHSLSLSLKKKLYPITEYDQILSSCSAVVMEGSFVGQICFLVIFSSFLSFLLLLMITLSNDFKTLLQLVTTPQSTQAYSSLGS